MIVSLGKGLILGLLARIFKYGNVVPLAVGLGLFQVGEFSFVLAQVGVSTNSISHEVYSLVLTTAIITMFLTPLISGQTARLYALRKRWFKHEALDSINFPKSGFRNHVIIIGGGRVGFRIAQVLKRLNVPLLIIELDQLRVDRAKHADIPVIYGESEGTAILALRWKGQLSENSKMLAYHNELPEMNHNEIVGWENNSDLIHQISVIWLKDEKDHPRTNIRQESTRELIGDFASKHEDVSVEGNTLVERYLHLIQYGDWVSYWCAILHQTDPTPVKKIDRLKGILSEKS